MNFRKLYFLALAFIIGGLAQAQSVQSTYSNNGLGEMLFQGLPHNVAMGEVGIAATTPWHINMQNPAGLAYNTLSSFQVGLNSDIRKIENATSDKTNYTGSVRFLALSFPLVRNRWTAGFALLPLTYMKYNTYSLDSIGTGVANVTQYQGNGGLTQLVWSNGVRVYKSLNLGVKMAYVFGSLNKESRVQLYSEDFASNYAISYNQKDHYSDLYFSLGLSYRQQLSEKQHLGIGLTYDLTSSLSGVRNENFERKSLAGTIIQTKVLVDNEVIKYNMPQTIGIGLSYEYLNKFRVAADYTAANWEKVQDNQVADIRNVRKVALGAEITPDYKSVNNYFKRVTYRMGAVYRELPYLVNSTEINDFGINFGASFPVSGVSSFDAAFKLGQRGTTDNNLIKENYFQIIIGATINDRWFIKRRYD